MNSIARIYAKAFFEVIKERNGSAGGIAKEKQGLTTIVETLRGNEQFKAALFSPVTSFREKVSLIEAVGKLVELSEVSTEFLKLLAKKGRIDLVEEVVSALDQVRLDAEGGLLGELVSADPVQAADVQAVADAFSKKLDRTVEFRTTVEPKLLAGIKVTVNGVTYDGTLRSQLERLKQQIVFGDAATVH